MVGLELKLLVTRFAGIVNANVVMGFLCAEQIANCLRNEADFV
jgi:hypothetical protein